MAQYPLSEASSAFEGPPRAKTSRHASFTDADRKSCKSFACVIALGNGGGTAMRRSVFREQLLAFAREIVPRVQVPQITFFIDEPHRGNAADAELLSEFILTPRFKMLRPRHFLALHDGLKLVLVLIEADADNFESLTVQLFVSRFHVRQFLHARPAPCGPKIHQHDFALHRL